MPKQRKIALILSIEEWTLLFEIMSHRDTLFVQQVTTPEFNATLIYLQELFLQRTQVPCGDELNEHKEDTKDEER